MANYTPTFTKPYPSGWVDKPSKTTPATAAIMNSYDTAIATLEAYLRDNAIDTVSVSVEQFPSDGRQWLGTITVGSNQYRIYMPSLKYENSVSDGIKIGTITLGEQSFDVYAPASSAGGSTVSVVPKTLTGTNIAEITVDGTTYQLYAPTGGGSGSTVTAEATLTEGTQIGKITIDGTETILYVPTASAIAVDTELSATSENPVQNKVVTAELDKKLEVLGDDAQAPDAVNFDLDSELSLTSVKGVQNKAIAEEFQKYANGTKVVAKATEAETAKTAASATTAQSATTAESATKATQDAQGNVIDTTYAKKTEIPQGAVVDDALSSTSENPVQNKVVKTEFDKVNSNSYDLKYGEVAGGKNLFKNYDVYNSYEVVAETYNGNSVIYSANTWYGAYQSDLVLKKGKTYAISAYVKGSGNYYILCNRVNGDNVNIHGAEKLNDEWIKITTVYTPPFDVNKVRIENNTTGGLYISCFQIEENTQATDYEPYIPSIKMLAGEIGDLDTRVSNNGCGELTGGKNLFTLKGKEIHTDNVKYEIINENSVSITGNDNCPSNQWVQIVVKNIKLKKNTDYVLSIGNVSNALSDTMCAVIRTDTSVTIGSMYNVQSNALIKFHVSDYDNVYIVLRHSQNDSSGASNHTIIWSNIQLEEGTQATGYEPYFPSNKMLAEENAQQSTEMMNIKMLGWFVPKECPIQNEINENQFVQKVGRVDLGSLDWVSVDTNTSLYTTSIKDIKTLSNNVFLLGYSVTSYDIETSKMTNKNIKMSGLDKQDFYIKNDSYTNSDSFKQAMQGQYLYYELATPITLTIDGNEAIIQLNSDVSNLKDGTTPVAKAVADEDGNNIKSTYATKAEIPSTPSSLYETVNVDIITDLFAKSVTQHYVNCERVGNICTLSFWLQATASVDCKNRHELFDIDKIPKNNLTIGFCVVNFNHSVSNTANSAYNYINSISVEEYYNAILKRNTSKVYLLPYRTGSNILSSGYEIIGQISWAVKI